MRMSFVNGSLTVTMAQSDLDQLLTEAREAGKREALAGGAETFPPQMAKNGTRTSAKKKPAKRTAARRKTARHHARYVPRPSMRRKVGKKRDWTAIVAKRLATQAANRERRRLEAQGQQVPSAEAI